MSDLQDKPYFERRVGVIDPLEADRFADEWHTVDFDPPFGSDKSVIVIPMTQTYNGTHTPGLRLRNVTNSSFEIRFDELIFHLLDDEEGTRSDGAHADEKVGWVAYGFKP